MPALANPKHEAFAQVLSDLCSKYGVVLSADYDRELYIVETEIKGRYHTAPFNEVATRLEWLNNASPKQSKA